MWSEDPNLARDLMTDDCVQWSAQTAGLDGVVGPEAAIEMMTAYRAQHINVFVARALVDAGDTFAYLWDVTTPDGEVHTGLDVNILRDGVVAENWTFVSDRRDDRTIPDGMPADRALLIDLARGRVAVMWAPETTGTQAGAVDLITVRDGRVDEVWSLPGQRPFAY